jgi:hypothetical protein
VWTEELLLLVEALDQPPPPFLPGKFIRVAHAQLPLFAVVARALFW